MLSLSGCGLILCLMSAILDFTTRCGGSVVLVEASNCPTSALVAVSGALHRLATFSNYIASVPNYPVSVFAPDVG